MNDAMRVRVAEGAGHVAKEARRLGGRTGPCSGRRRKLSPSTNGMVNQGSPPASPAVRSGTT